MILLPGQKRVSIESIERQKRLKFFGDANEESNKGLTIIGPLTYIQYLDEKPKIEKKPLSNFKINNSSKAYRPSKERLKNINIPDDFGLKSGFIKGGYIPKNIKEQLKEDANNEPISIILKNFPTYLEYNQLKDLFRNHFKSYGDIKRITILKDKQGNIKDIAFIEYYYNKDALKVLENKKRLRMGNYIVSIERKKERKKLYFS